MTAHQLFRKVTIVGIGLMGGSLGMALKKYQLAGEVIGVSRNQSSLAYAMEHHAIDQVASDLKRGVMDADLVVLATPVKTILELIPMIAGSLKRGCIVTDVGSTKAQIVEEAAVTMRRHHPPDGNLPGGGRRAGAPRPVRHRSTRAYRAARRRRSVPWRTARAAPRRPAEGNPVHRRRRRAR